MQALREPPPEQLQFLKVQLQILKSHHHEFLVAHQRLHPQSKRVISKRRQFGASDPSCECHSVSAGAHSRWALHDMDEPLKVTSVVFAGPR